MASTDARNTISDRDWVRLKARAQAAGPAPLSPQATRQRQVSQQSFQQRRNN